MIKQKGSDQTPMKRTSGKVKPNRVFAQSDTQQKFKFANLTISIVFFLALFASAQNHPNTQSLDGFWLTDGYGELLEFKGNDLEIYDITKLSCISSEKASRKVQAGTADEIIFAADGDMFHFAPGPTRDTFWLHEGGTVWNVLLRRVHSRPKPCDQPLADTPLTNYDVFWETFAEQYAFFGLHKVNWRTVDKKFRPQVTPETTPEELLAIFKGMVEPLHDKHVYIYAPSLHNGFRGKRTTANTLQNEDIPRTFEIIRTKYVLGDLRYFCNGQLQFGMLRLQREPDPERNEQAGSVAYLRIYSFAHYSKDEDFQKQLAALDTALDEIFKDTSRWRGLVIDIRINIGGDDQLGLAIASRLTNHDYLAWQGEVHDDIHDPDHHTAPQPIMVHFGQRRGFRGPVVLLTSPYTMSGGETFTLALLGRVPHVIRIGTNTQGVFSDELSRTLPNGWRFALSNEIYLTKDGKTFEGTGVPPDIEVPTFPKGDLAGGRDSALDRALEVLAHSLVSW